MTIDPEDWEPQAPPPDFADRVMARVHEGTLPEIVAAPQPLPRSPRRAVLTTAIGLAAGIAIALGARSLHRAPDHGAIVATGRTEVRVGARAIAVLEPGAEIRWNGDDVEQPAGDVFYRVEPGGAFRVHTPAGDATDLGTCFRVQLEGEHEREGEAPMNARDLKAGAVGAALTAAALVSVYEGKVAVSRGSERATLTAGERARVGAAGIARDDGNGGPASGIEVAGGSGGGGDDPLLAANANLADSVREYQRRLTTIEAQKAAIAKQLTEAQQKLATAQNDGQAAPTKSPYELSDDDWKEMAKEGKVIARTPCASPSSWMPTPAQLDRAGLAPSDAQPIHDAREQSFGRVWGTIRPLCVQALLGDAKVADRLGSYACTSLVSDMASVNGENTEDEIRAVAEMRAGLRPYDAKALGSLGQILYVESGETKAMMKQLTQSIGPDDARAAVYGDTGCWSNQSSTVGPHPVLPPK